MGAAMIGQRGATVEDMIGRRPEAMIAAMVAATSVRHTPSADMATGGMTAAIPGSMTAATTGDMLLPPMGEFHTLENSCRYRVVLGTCIDRFDTAELKSGCHFNSCLMPTKRLGPECRGGGYDRGHPDPYAYPPKDPYARYRLIQGNNSLLRFSLHWHFEAVTCSCSNAMLHRDAYRYEEAPPSYGYSDRGGYAAPYTSGGPITDRCALSWRHFLSCGESWQCLSLWKV
jgi:hypothetical protein